MKRILSIIVILLLSLSFTKDSYKPTIAIDLDGILNNYIKYNENHIPEIKEGTKDFIIELSKEYNLILFTNRNIKQAVKWLIENNLESYFYDVTNIKPKATIYIDDRAINFNGDYNKAINEVKNFKVYWKNKTKSSF